MQYVRSLTGSASKAWNSINPATLSGAVDVIVVEQEDGMLRHRSAWELQRLRGKQARWLAHHFTSGSANGSFFDHLTRRYVRSRTLAEPFITNG